MKIGIQIVHEGMSYKAVEETAMAVDNSGFDCVWIGDHFWFTSPRKRFLECGTLLSALATKTKKVRIGSLVFNNLFRRPWLVAHMASTLDIISNGRFNLGVGAGWHKKECEMFDIPFPEVGKRIEQLSHDLDFLKNVFSHLESVQKPHPPIWVGGFGNYILKVAAKHADASNFERFDLSPQKCKERLEYLGRQCKKFGRPLKERSICLTIAFEKEYKIKEKLPLRNYFSKDYFKLALDSPSTALKFVLKRGLGMGKPNSFITGSLEEVISRLREYADVGITYFVVRFTSFENLEILAKKILPVVERW